MSGPRLKVEGLDEIRRALRQAGDDLPKQMRLVNNQASQVIIDYARPRFATLSGKAKGSLKARSGQLEVRIAYGGRAAPYAPWLDFGGTVGRRKSVSRPFLREGRYLYPGLRAKRDDIQMILDKGMTDLATGAGFEVT